MAEKVKPKWYVFVVFYTVLFFANWFGSSRFDTDGDGDFDPEDVQAYLEDREVIKKYFNNTLKAKQQAARAKAKALAKAKAKAKAAADRPQSPTGRGGVSPDGIDLGLEDVSDALGAKVDGEEQEQMAFKALQQTPPWFIILECSAVFLLWFIMAIIREVKGEGVLLKDKAGLDTIFEGMTDLRLASSKCDDYRPQVWRWLTYQFTHIGAMHCLMNVFLNVTLGIPLEGVHGAGRMFLMFNTGVLGGALCYMFNDAHTVVVGCSGGCYSLIGMHLADLVMNWPQKKFRYPTLAFIALLVLVDVLSYAMSLSPEAASHSAHVGGFVAGAIMGVVIGKNLQVEQFEKVLQFVLGMLGLMISAFCIIWLAANPAPRNIWEASSGAKGWCWIRQVFDAHASSRWECIRCGNMPCIDQWSRQKHIQTVAMDVCLKQATSTMAARPSRLAPPVWALRADRTWRRLRFIARAAREAGTRPCVLP